MSFDLNDGLWLFVVFPLDFGYFVCDANRKYFNIFLFKIERN